MPNPKQKKRSHPRYLALDSLDGLPHVTQLAVTPNGKFVISATDNFNLKVWAVATGQLMHTLNAQPDLFSGMAVTPDGKHVLSAAYSRQLKIWNIQTGEEATNIDGYRFYSNPNRIFNENQEIITASNDSTLKKWELPSGEIIFTFIGHLYWFVVVQANFDLNKAIYTLSEYELMSHMRPESYNIIGQAEDQGRGEYALIGIHDLKWTRNASLNYETFSQTPDHLYRITPIDKGGKRVVWDLANGVEVCQLPPSTNPNITGVGKLAIKPDCQQIIEGADEKISIFNKTSGKELYTIVAHEYGINAIAIMPDNEKFVSASWDGTLKVWALATGKLLAEFNAGVEFSTCVVAQDGTIVAGEGTGRVFFLRLEQFQATYKLRVIKASASEGES